MVSRIDEGKGQDTLIKAANLLIKKQKNLVFLIVGEGDDKKLKNLIKKFNLESCVTLLGFREDLYEIMSIFDIAVFPTRWELEGFGIVSLEYMMLGIPLVASNFGPVPEVVGDAALLTEPKPDDLARNIEKLLKNKKLRKELAEKGQERVKKYYEIGSVADKYLNLFNTV